MIVATRGESVTAYTLTERKKTAKNIPSSTKHEKISNAGCDHFHKVVNVVLRVPMINSRNVFKTLSLYFKQIFESKCLRPKSTISMVYDRASFY